MKCTPHRYATPIGEVQFVICIQYEWKTVEWHVKMANLSQVLMCFSKSYENQFMLRKLDLFASYNCHREQIFFQDDLHKHETNSVPAQQPIKSHFSKWFCFSIILMRCWNSFLNTRKRRWLVVLNTQPRIKIYLMPLEKRGKKDKQEGNPGTPK